MATEVSIIIKGKDLASGAFKKVEKAGAKAGQVLKKNWKEIAAGAAVAGAALEAMGRSAAKNNEALGKLSAATGIQVDELRNLAIETANVTRPIDLTIDLFKRAKEQGLESAEQLQKFAEVWDTVGDATGENAAELGKASVALRGMGIAAGEDEKAMAALGFIMNDTTLSVGEFLQFIDKAGPELREMNIGVNESAAIIGILTNEMGMSARTARTEFIQAVTESDGNLQKLYDTLGINQTQLSNYTQKVNESSDAIQTASDIHAESYTVLQELQHWLSEVTLKHGELLQAASMLAPVMIGLSITVTAMATIVPALSTALTFLNTQLALTSTLTWSTVGAVGALKTAFLLLGSFVVGWKIGTWLTEKFDVVRQLGISLAAGFLKVWEWISAGVKIMAEVVGRTFLGVRDMIFSFVAAILERTAGVFEFFGLDAASERAQDLANSLMNVVGNTKSLGQAVGDITDKMHQNISRIEDDAVSMWDRPVIKSQEATQAIAQNTVTMKDTMAETDTQISENWNMMWDGMIAKIETAPLAETGIMKMDEFGSGIAGSEAPPKGMKSQIDRIQAEADAFNAGAKGFEKGSEFADGYNKGASKAGFQIGAITGEYQVQMSQADAERAAMWAGVTGGRGFTGAGFKMFQEGGVATRPTPGIFGEAGPEALIPLDKFGGGLGGKVINNYYNIEFKGPMMGNPDEARLFAREMIGYLTDEYARK